MTIYGLDFSHYDSVPNGTRVVSEGFSFMTHKAGGDKDDAELGAWWRAMKPQRDKVLLGAYWVLYPGSPTGRASAFLARLDDQCPGWRDGPFILQLDCEIWNGDTSTKPDRTDIAVACGYLHAKMPKLRPVVYASAGQYGDSLKGLGYPLWNARYPTSKTSAASLLYSQISGDFGSGWNAYSGQTPAIWQFSSSATAVGQSTCDVNAFRGTLNELTALLAPGWSDDMDITQANLDAIAKAVWDHEENDPNPEITGATVRRVGGDIRYLEARRRDMEARLNAAIAANKVTPESLALALAPLLPSDADVTPEALQAAMVGALKQLAAADADPPADTQ